MNHSSNVHNGCRGHLNYSLASARCVFVGQPPSENTLIRGPLYPGFNFQMHIISGESVIYGYTLKYCVRQRYH